VTHLAIRYPDVSHSQGERSKMLDVRRERKSSALALILPALSLASGLTYEIVTRCVCGVTDGTMRIRSLTLNS
jgi:hypothetical protein